MLTWTLDTDGMFHSTDGRFDMYPERRPENDHRLTWTLIDRDAAEGVENGFDSHAVANSQAERLTTLHADAVSTHMDALDESITRLFGSGKDLHDDGLILAMAATGERWWTIATRLGLSDGYVKAVLR